MLPTPLPAFQDDLVILRPLVPADREALFGVASDPELWAQHQCKDRYRRPVFEGLFDDAIACGGAYTLLDRKRNNRIIGSTRLRSLTPTATEIGWTFLDRAYWGTAYNGAMKRLLIRYVHERGMDVVFYVHEDNMRSRGAVGKLGAVLIRDTDNPVMTDREGTLNYLLRPSAT
jgi:RimJ/RimL family protein N-acetyltransferase